MNTCDTCKFFDQSPEGVNYGSVSTFPRGSCLHIKCGEGEGETWNAIQDGIYGWCDEWRGHITVGPKFGCVHWEGKELGYMAGVIGVSSDVMDGKVCYKCGFRYPIEGGRTIRKCPTCE